jgi:hypothetical protein
MAKTTSTTLRLLVVTVIGLLAMGSVAAVLVLRGGDESPGNAQAGRAEGCRVLAPGGA